MAIKNDVEVEGMRKAYLRDGVSFVRVPPVMSQKVYVRLTLSFPGTLPCVARDQTGGWLRHIGMGSCTLFNGVSQRNQELHGFGL